MFFLISHVFENILHLRMKTNHPWLADRGGFCIV